MIESQSFSHATLRMEDLIPAALQALAYVGSYHDDAEQAGNALRAYNYKLLEWNEICDKLDDRDDGGHGFYNDLCDAIDSYLPRGLRYGCTEGDGSDIGICEYEADEPED